MEIVAVLLSNGANVNQTKQNGETPLHAAAYCGRDYGVAVLLIDKGANVNLVNHDGASPLHFAAENRNDAVAAILIEKGADVNQVDLDGDRPIDVAETQKIKDMLIALTEEKRDDQAIDSKVVDEAQWFRAAKKGKLAVIKQGIKDKIDVNCRDSTGCTALSLATQRDHISVVEYLFSQGADVSIPSVSAIDVFLSATQLAPALFLFPSVLPTLLTPTIILRVA